MLETTTRPAIDRALMERDLRALAALLAPAIEARMAVLEPLFRTPVIGSRLRALLTGSPQTMTYNALASLLSLDDDELAPMIDLVGRELGAWRAYNDPVTDDELAAAAPGYDRLLDVV